MWSGGAVAARAAARGRPHVRDGPVRAHGRAAARPRGRRAAPRRAAQYVPTKHTNIYASLLLHFEGTSCKLITIDFIEKKHRKLYL